MNPHSTATEIDVLVNEYIDTTDQMAELKEKNRARRIEMERQRTDELNAMRDAERALSARRAQVALKMTQTGRNLADLGLLVGVSGPFICQLARKAKEENENG